MRQILFLFFIAGFMAAKAQQPANLPIEAYNAIPGVKLVANILKEDLVGELRQNYGLSGSIIQLNPDMSFQVFSYDCLSKTQISNGSWMIAFNRMLRLDSPKGWKLFDIVKIDNRYYFVEPVDRREFIRVYVSKSKSGPIHGILNFDHFAKEIK